ncbi:MAG TPA: hypothetical protein VE010_24070, partial [Thermoanaerobaculia bacterium]|nr:hypothetical protein [Thermoanaerobaculia bacterium]
MGDVSGWIRTAEEDDLRHRAAALSAVLLVCFTVASAVQAQSRDFQAIPSPNPLTLRSGGPAATVTVSTLSDAYVGASITYSFSGFPSGIRNDGPKTTFYNQGASPFYQPVTFTFSARPGTPAGTYTGTLTGSTSDGLVRTFPFTVIVQQPDILLSVAQPQMSLCAGAPAQSNSVRIDPVGGYEGTPQVEFFNVPAGVTITPNPLPPAPLPPGRTLPFTVSATEAGRRVITVRVIDPQYGIDRTTTLILDITAPAVTASVTPMQVPLVAGGTPGTVVASIVPNACLTEPVSVTVNPPPGLIITPAVQTFAPPAYAPASFSIQASQTAAPGTYPVTFTFFNVSGSTARAVTIEVVVSAAPDFILRATPPAISVAAGTTGSVDISAEALNGFQGPISVTGTAPAGITIAPPAFTVTPGSPQRVAIAVPRAVAPGPYTVTFTGMAAGVPQPRSVNVVVNVTAPPDFRLAVTPSSVNVVQGSAVTVIVTAPPLNGFAEPVAVTVQTPPSLTVTPSTFVLPPGGSQQVTIAAAPNATPGVAEIVFTGTTASGLVHTAELQVTIAPLPPVITSITPPAVTTGVRSIVVRLTGLNFRPGAVVTSRTPGVIIERTELVSPTAALVTLSVRADAAPGAYLLDLRNPDGGITAQGTTLLVYPRESIGAPLGVTAAAIVFPRTGTMVATDEAVYARGLLATTGT